MYSFSFIVYMQMKINVCLFHYVLYCPAVAEVGVRIRNEEQDTYLSFLAETSRISKLLF
jgi:hypothetical protein